VYEYFCKPCNAVDEVTRSISDADHPYKCPDCGGKTRKIISKTNAITTGEDAPYLHPAFGTVMTNKQAAAEAKRRGWIEVGNEDVAKHTPPPPRKDYEENDYFM
jgi:putative FmdB family regulatory protein